MNFCAYLPTTDMQSANDALEFDGFGPNNFSVPVYDGPTATGAMLHCWNDPVFQSAVEAIPNVVITFPDDLPIPSDIPAEIMEYGSELEGMTWGSDALPLTGNVTPGLYVDDDNTLWWVIQAYDTAVYPDPTIIPALIRQAKIPGEALPWIQPLDQYDAYKLLNPFTGEGDMCTHNGDTWQVTDADGAGNNVWEPGVFGWTVM